VHLFPSEEERPRPKVSPGARCRGFPSYFLLWVLGEPLSGVDVPEKKPLSKKNTLLTTSIVVNHYLKIFLDHLITFFNFVSNTFFKFSNIQILFF